ncbi:glycine hydroxymethyltransferase [Sarotherodon galilaeus]
MTHFRGLIRGPHWGLALDNKLIDFWRKHECLFNSSAKSYYDKDLKTKLWTEFALSIGKPVSDVERRARSLRTQYGRVLYHAEKVSPGQQKRLREKLGFLRPYIVRRRGYSSLEDNFVDHDDEDEEELETEGSIDQEMGSSLSSQLDADGGGQDLDEPQSVDSAPSFAPLQCPQPQVTEVMSLSCPHHHDEDHQPDKTAALNAPKHDVLNQFAEVMLADMRQVEDPVLLMRLRRDITDLVFKAVEEDVRRRCIRAPSSVMGNGTQSCCSPLQLYSNISWSQRLLRRRRRNKGCRTGSRSQRQEEIRRVSRSQLAPPVHPGQAAELMSANRPQVTLQVFEIKKGGEPDVVKIEDEPLALD